MLTDEVRAYFRELAAARQRQRRNCAMCGVEFRALAWQLHCSARCRNRAGQRAKRARAKAQAKE